MLPTIIIYVAIRFKDLFAMFPPEQTSNGKTHPALKSSTWV